MRRVYLNQLCESLLVLWGAASVSWVLKVQIQTIKTIRSQEPDGTKLHFICKSLIPQDVAQYKCDTG